MALRRTVAAASVALAAIALAGCSASGSNAPSFPPIEQPSPTKSVGMPTDLQAWAAVALPEDKTGGATFVARDIGAVTATQGAQVSIGQAAGTWDAVIACQSSDGSTLSAQLLVNGVAVGDARTVDCATPSDPATPGVTTLSFAGDAPTELTLTGSASAVFVYEIVPHSNAQD